MFERLEKELRKGKIPGDLERADETARMRKERGQDVPLESDGPDQTLDLTPVPVNKTETSLYFPSAVTRYERIQAITPNVIDEIAERTLRAERSLIALKESISALLEPYQVLFEKLAFSNDSAQLLSRTKQSRVGYFFQSLGARLSGKSDYPRSPWVIDRYAYSWDEFVDINREPPWNPLPAVKFSSELQYDEVNQARVSLIQYHLGVTPRGERWPLWSLNMGFQNGSISWVANYSDWPSYLLLAMEARRKKLDHMPSKEFVYRSIKSIKEGEKLYIDQVVYNLLDDIPSLVRSPRSVLPDQFKYNPETNTFRIVLTREEEERQHGLLDERDSFTPEEFLRSLEELLYLIPALPSEN